MIDEVDFRTKVVRDELNSMSKDLFNRLRGPIDAVLKQSGLTMVHLIQFFVSK